MKTNKFIFLVAMLSIVCSQAFGAIEPLPNWWDHPQIIAPGSNLPMTVTFKPITGSGIWSETYAVDVPNAADATKKKEVFMVLSWKPIGGIEPSDATELGPRILWPAFTEGDAPRMNLIETKNDAAGYITSYYSYSITPQPPTETIYLAWDRGLNSPASGISFLYDIRTFCVPVPLPAASGLYAVGLLVMSAIGYCRKVLAKSRFTGFRRMLDGTRYC